MPVTVNLKQGTVTSVFAVGLLNGSPPLQFVTAQVTGVPGMPGTGSDPYAPQPTEGNTQQVPLGWLALIVAVVAAAEIGTALHLSPPAPVSPALIGLIVLGVCRMVSALRGTGNHTDLRGIHGRGIY